MRACLRAPVDFTVRMRLRDPAVDRLESLEDALVCLGTLGGMGAKSRKGYGSLVIRSLLVDGEERWQIPETLTELCGSLLGRQPQPERQTDGLPAYTALSAGARHVLVATEREHAMELLDHVGRELMRYRSWGHNGKLLGQRSERNFPDDHDLMKGDGRGRHPRRVAFGLPHNYGSGRDKQVRPAGNLDRRASPLFIHVHECGDSPVGVLSFLPARFLPPGIDISVGRDRVRQAPEAELYQPIQEFLNRLLDPRKRKEPFTEVVEVP